jgi:hypothetical protein
MDMEYSTTTYLCSRLKFTKENLKIIYTMDGEFTETIKDNLLLAKNRAGEFSTNYLNLHSTIMEFGSKIAFTAMEP